MDSDDLRVATDGVSVQEKSSSSVGKLEVRYVWPGSEQHYRMMLKQLGLERGKQLLIYSGLAPP